MRYLSIVGSMGVLVVVLLAAHVLPGNRTVANAAVSGVFEGTSPGVTHARPFLKIPLTDKCDFIKWKLTLLQDDKTKTPATFRLEQEYGFYVDNRTDKTLGQAVIEGRWEITKGIPSKPDAVVYRLYSGPHSIYFVQLDHHLLHFLDADKKPAVGNGGQSFTLSRTGKIIPPMSIYQALQASTSLTSGIKDSVLIYEGRTPCTAIARELNLPANAECFKLKWLLTLYQDPQTFRPTRYQLKRTLHRQSIIEGTWTVVKGTAADPQALVYLIDPGKPGYTFYLMKGDDNVLFFLDKERNLLVGNNLFSYTLNRRKL
jgi:hypothetical protein